MGVIDRFGRKQSATTRLVASIVLGGNQPVWTPIRYERLAKEGFQRNTWVYACVSGIAGACKGIPWVVYTGQGERGQKAASLLRKGYEPALRRQYGRPPADWMAGCAQRSRVRAWSIRVALERRDLHEVDAHPLLDLFHRPNPQMGGGAFQEAFFAYLLISGNSYVEAVSVGGRPPVELWPHRPDRMRVIPSPTLRVGGYEYQAGGQKLQFDPSQVMHTKFFHPTNDWYGMSPLEAAARAVDRDNAAEAWNTSLIQNGARPSGALVSQGQLDDEQFQQVKAQIDERSHPESAGRPWVLEGGLDWKEMGLTPRDMDWLAGQEWGLARIAAAFGYPVPLLYPKGTATYANYQEARQALYQDRVLPLMDHAADDWNNWLVPKFGDNLLLAYDAESIEALQEDRNALWTRTRDQRMLLDEQREAVGLEPLPNGAGQVIILPTGASVRPADDLLPPPAPEPVVDPAADPATGDDPAQAAKRRRKAVGGGVGADWWLQGAEEWMLQVTAQKVGYVSAFTRNTISALITEGVQAGESMVQIAARILETYADMSETRARLIARTEVIGAANAGGRFAALSTGLDLEKEWLATMDERTRPDHADTDGQRRQMHAPYDVGGYAGMFPGDPSLPPSEVCNCRCTEVYVRPQQKQAGVEERSEVWRSHDATRSAWEAVVAKRAAAVFAREGATLAAGVKTDADGHTAVQLVEQLPVTPWLDLFHAFYTGVIEDFGGRALVTLAKGSA